MKRKLMLMAKIMMIYSSGSRYLSFKNLYENYYTPLPSKAGTTRKVLRTFV